jgi:hypothetical protein
LLSFLAALSCAFFAPALPIAAGTTDWVVTIETRVIERCLAYPNSKLSPLIRAAVSFEQALLESAPEDKELIRKGAEPDILIPPTLYENQYFSHFRTIGLRRFKQLVIKPGTTGTIKIISSNSASRQEEANAAASATVRLYLDLYLNKMPLRSVIVSKGMFDAFIQELQRYGFKSFNIVPGQMTNALVMLSIRSEPAGKQQYMSYGN